MSARVLTANRLDDGAVVYRDASGGWVERLADAAVAEDETTERALLDAGEADLARGLIVGPYLMAVVCGSAPAPMTQRERIRAAGPTVAFGTKRIG